MIQQAAELRTRIWGLVLPIMIGLLVIIIIAMGLVYFQEKRGQPALEEQISNFERSLSQSTDPTPEQQAQYNEAHQAVTTEIDEEQVIKAVVNLAKEHGFEVGLDEQSDIQIKASTAKTETVIDANYQILPFQINIDGDYDSVRSFIDDIAIMPSFKTLVIESLSIKKTDGGETSATIDFIIYTLKT